MPLYSGNGGSERVRPLLRATWPVRCIEQIHVPEGHAEAAMASARSQGLTSWGSPGGREGVYH